MPFCERTRMTRLHERAKAAAIHNFRSRLRVHGAEKKRRDDYMNQLTNDIDRLYDSYVRKNSAKVFLIHFFFKFK